MERVIRELCSKRAVDGVNTAVKPERRTLRSLRKNASFFGVIRTARLTCVKVLRGLETINLGGTAEAVFRPILGQEMAVFYF